MKIDKQMIESILGGYLEDEEICQLGQDKCSRGELVDQLMRELNHIDDIRIALARNKDTSQALTCDYHTEMEKCDIIRDAIIDACIHHSTTLHNDSETVCNICGKVLR